MRVFLWLLVFFISLVNAKDLYPVVTAKVKLSEEIEYVKFSAITRAQEHALLSFTVGGKLLERSVEVGDEVEKGQALAKIDQRPYTNAVNIAKAQLSQQQALLREALQNKKRVGKLIKQNLTSQEELDAVTAQVSALQAAVMNAQTAVEEAERQLEETTLYAPFAGKISKVYRQANEYAQPGSYIVALTNYNKTVLEIDLPETWLKYLDIDQEVKIKLPLEERLLQANVHSIGLPVANTTQLFPVMIVFNKEVNVRPGITAELLLPRRHAIEIAVPLLAINNPTGQKSYLFKVIEDKSGYRVEKVFISVVRLQKNHVVIESNQLNVNDKIVISGQQPLLHGDSVEIIEEKAL